MYDVALLLHIYQPPTQFPEITREISETSYWPVVKVLARLSQVKVTFNICASLTEQLERLGYEDLLAEMGQLAEDGKIEFTGSAKYHPLLSKLPPREIKHQIDLNQETNERLLGQVFKTKGFFPPEMAYSSHVARIVEQMGFAWLVVDDLAFPGDKDRRYDCTYRIDTTRLRVLFRDRLLSLGIALGTTRSADEFVRCLEDRSKEGYCILAMDGETFGHHHKDAVGLFEDLLVSPKINWLGYSDLVKKYSKREEEVEPLASTWGLMEIGPRSERIFPRWDNPENPVHQLQWQLFYLALSVMGRCDSSQEGYLEARVAFDKAVHSDHFFWAGGDPCWHPGMVERGAILLREVIEKCPAAFAEEREKASQLAELIVARGKELYGEEIILE